MSHVLIIGGKSGLGLALGERLRREGQVVHETGRAELEITADSEKLLDDLDKFVKKLPQINLLIYAAGFMEKGHIDSLSDEHIMKMVNVGITAPALLLQRLIQKQGSLSGFIVITSTSQWIPRELEPIYTSTKAGLAMLAQSVSLDPRVEKTLVVGPAGMNTPFWSGTRSDAPTLLSPSLVAEQILGLWADAYQYRLARILRDPERIQILETR